MSKARDIVGVIAAALMLLSSAAHVLLGWKALSAELEAAHVQGELLLGLRIGWYFGGVAMLLLGIILLTLFAARLRGERRPLLPAAVVALGYLAFGGWALTVSGNPFFMVFIVPGALLAVASLFGS
jgi:hypothetical protein